MARDFSIPIRVYYEDTDAGGVVYYANYLKFMERARTEWLRSLGFEQDEMKVSDGVLFAVRSANLDFIHPAHFNDKLQVSLQISKRGKASLEINQVVSKNNTALCVGEIKIACIAAATFSPCPIPANIGKQIDDWI